MRRRHRRRRRYEYLGVHGQIYDFYRCRAYRTCFSNFQTTSTDSYLVRNLVIHISAFTRRCAFQYGRRQATRESETASREDGARRHVATDDGCPAAAAAAAAAAAERRMADDARCCLLDHLADSLHHSATTTTHRVTVSGVVAMGWAQERPQDFG